MKETAVATVKVKKEESIGEVVLTVIYALLVALVIRTLFFEPFNIPSGSMTPTLLTGDYVFVSKFSYGYSRYSLPFAPSFLHGRIFGSLPKRGDVAVFINPHTGEDYIKRIVGLPGDHIQVVHGVLTINGEAAKREKIDDYVEREWDDNYDREYDTLRYRYVETMPNGVKHEILGEPTSQPEDSLPQDDTQIFEVPADSFFAMGDNRDNSADSRVPVDAGGVGMLPIDDLVGRVDAVVGSWDLGMKDEPVWTWPSGLRLSRFFSAVN